MSELIEVNNLSKSFLIAHEAPERYTTLSDVISNNIKNIFTLPSKKSSKSYNEEFWALKDVNFHVKQGEIVGIIGRNGAGKSTLLKILSRITGPTSGNVKLRGRVASLLEVGTGFHPELTGRDNIYLNGSILGMSRKEIRNKFDEIVDFSGVERFLDTPVKRYSSGMYVRLAFAIAAHLDPEILIVDEVLAVGDIEFQQKCLNKMKDLTGSANRTVLFVSHNIGAIRSICQRGILLKEGRLIADGEVGEVVQEYLQSETNDTGIIDLSILRRTPKYSPLPCLKKAWIETPDQGITNEILMGHPFKICFSFEADREIFDPVPGIEILSNYGDGIANVTSRHIGVKFSKMKKGMVEFNFNEIHLMPGTYYITIQLYENVSTYVDIVSSALKLVIHPYNKYGSTQLYMNGNLLYLSPSNISMSNS
jgi:lipopolysaccharide transport system ATP-binding protein